MSKLAWVLLPLLLAAAAVGWLWWKKRLPSRMVLNAAFSALLLVYVLITAGLGIFWVANQHLPVFDWHYLFGYAMLVLLAVHLAFNFRMLLHHLRRNPARPAAAPVAGRRPVIGALGVLGAAMAAGIGYFIGLRHGRTELRIEATGPAGADAAATALAVVHEFHEFSSHTRAGVLRRAPGADWGSPPPPFKRLSGGPRIALPPPRSAGGSAGVDLALLGDMLWHAAGVSQESAGIHFRTSPSSGALFATELYVAARQVPGLPPGLWHYDVPGHALHAVASEPGLPGLQDLHALQALSPDEWPADAAALVLSTAIFRRSGHKYRDRTYRYVLGDLGHLLENLRVVAQAAGARATLLPRLDEARIAKALAINEAEEGVLAAMLLQDAAAPALPVLQRDASAAWAPPPLGAGAGSGSLLGVTDAIHRATSLRGPRALVFEAAAASWVAPAQALAGAVRLPQVATRIADPRPLIASRRSMRRYTDDALVLEDLAALLSTAMRPGPQLSGAVVVDLIAHHVAGLPAGAWRYHPGQHALEPRRAASTAEAERLRARSRAAGLDQDVIGNAAVVFVLAIHRAAFAAHPSGAARGYRQAFIESGLVGERLYFEAGARGLGCCAVGAFYDDEAAALVGSDPALEWTVHFAAVGRLGT